MSHSSLSSRLPNSSSADIAGYVHDAERIYRIERSRFSATAESLKLNSGRMPRFTSLQLGMIVDCAFRGTSADLAIMVISDSKDEGWGMEETFKQMFARISPLRRAQVVFGMDQLHRKYLATTGGSSRLPYDAADHLTDEETIKAYLGLVRQAADHFVMMQARVDVARARIRLAEETSHVDEAPSDPVQPVSWPRRREALFRNHLPKSELQRILAKSDRLSGQPHRPPLGGKKVIRPSRPTE